MLYGVDVHGTYQRGLSFPTLAKQGYSFAVTKATEGTSYVAPSFVEWTAAARAAGMIPGAYHWLHRGAAVEQARFFYDRVRQAGGPGGMLIQLDCEDDADWPTLQAWDAEWARLSGGHPYLIYTGRWWWDTASRGWPGVTLTPHLWHSEYLTADLDSVPDDPAAFAARIPASWWTTSYGGWPTATILQFTSKGDAGGLANNVDLNAFRGTREQLLALTHPPEDDMALRDDKDFHYLIHRLYGLQMMADPILIPPHKPTDSAAVSEPNLLARALRDAGLSPEELAQVVTAVATAAHDGAASGAPTDPQAVAGAVLDGLRAHPLTPTP